MLPIDAISDVLNKLFDKAQQFAPTVWEAALHQVAINARISFMWGVGWSVAAGIFALIGLGVPVLYAVERRQYRRAIDAMVRLTTVSTGLTTYAKQNELDKIRYRSDPNDNLPATAWGSVVAWGLVVFCMVFALSSFWNAWQMTQNPTWWAIQLLKG